MSAQNTPCEEVLSYELYRELAEDLCVPVDGQISPDVRFELYNSKLIYLRHLREQCFRAVNQANVDSPFSESDLALIQKAATLTHLYLRSTVLEAVNDALAKIRRS